MTNTENIRREQNIEMMDAIEASARTIAQDYNTEDVTPTSHTEALKRLANIEEYADIARRDIVRNMRAQGLTWADIGDAIGITRQAAQQRFGA